MFRVKICGVTQIEDALTAFDAGADAIGLNFYEQSPRFVKEQKARQIADALGRHREAFVERHFHLVGVFVNHTFKQVNYFCQRSHCPVQLHGDDSPQHVARVKKAQLEWSEPNWIQVIWARRLGEGGIATLAADLEEAARAGAKPDAVLVDAAAGSAYGGTGVALDWKSLAGYESRLGDTPLILAGGLTPDNIAEAIRIVRPAAVDVASGVESAPGKKDPAKVRDFVANALGAFEGLGT